MNRYLFLFIGLLSSAIYAQKTNITDAALRYKKYNPMLVGIEPSKKILEEAKSFIDLAYVNAETSASTAMHSYRGQIYFGLMEIYAMDAAMNNKKPDMAIIEGFEKNAIESFDAVLNAPKAKEKNEVLSFINGRSSMTFEMGLSVYNKRNYEQATQLFLSAYQISKYAHIDNEDARANSVLSFIKAMDTLMEQKAFIEATEFGEMMYQEMPTELEVLISMINLNLQKSDNPSLEKYLNAATSLDPTNKQLFCVLGTALLELKQYERAEEAFLKALAIDPSYPQAVYQYGTHLFNWSRDLANEAGDLKVNDPNIAILTKRSNEIMLKVLTLIDPFIEKNPNDKTALEIGWKANYILDNEDKYNELKKRWEAIK